MDSPVAVITGAGRGIGRATAVELSAAGYRLALVARNRMELDETSRLAGGGLIAPADVTDPGQVDRAVKSAMEIFGRIDAMIHCAGVAPALSLAQMTVEQWHEVIDTNLSAAFYLCRAVWPIFEKRGGGVVVNVSSMAGRDPFQGLAAYGAAKAGLNILGLSAAREGDLLGIRVHTIAPGATETAMFRKLLTPEQYPAEKTLAPAEVARVIVQCVRGDLRYTSGEVIYLHKRM